MQRRKFLQQTGLLAGSVIIMKDLFAKSHDPLYGHNGMVYKMDTKWGTQNPDIYPVNDCHEMVQDKQGRLVLLTNETKNNILVYDTSGKVLEAWGHNFPGAHGLTLHNENGDDFLYITDTNLHQVYKTTMNGQVLLTIDYPCRNRGV